jgi:hypothetical protein
MKKVFLLLIAIVPISIYSQISVEFTQLNVGCSSVNKGVMKVKIIGGTEPYTLDWKDKDVDPSDSFKAINLWGGKHKFSVTDFEGAQKDTTYIVEVMKAPQLNIYVTPGDTLYIKNPTGQFFFENPESEINPVLEWLWDFGDNNTTVVESPVHTYSLMNEYFATLKISYAENCDTTFVHPVKVKNVKLFIPNVITPNGDQHNNYFVITDMREKNSGQSVGSYSLINDFYISNELVIYNRWGKTVFEAKNYLNDWDGGSLKDGVYFYVLKCVGKFETEVYKGTITILGSNN